MSNPFDSSRRKIARGKEHVANLEREVLRFTENATYTRFTEPDVENPTLTVHKVRLDTPIPDGLSEVAGDAIGNLRQALDHATFAIAVAAGNPHPKSAYFPFGKSPTDVENALKGNCKDVPKDIYPLLRSFKPHETGNEVLFTLNRMVNRDKHALLIAIGTVAMDGGMEVVSTEGFWSMPSPHFWDQAKQEMVLITLAPNAKCNAHFRFFTTIAFSGIENVKGIPVLHVLSRIAEEIEATVSAMENECRRLGIIG